MIELEIQDKIIQKYKTLCAKYKDVDMPEDKRERLKEQLWDEAIDFVRFTEEINNAKH